MAAKTYGVLNGDVPGAAAAVPIATSTVIKTHLQIATNTTTPAIRFVEWWVEFDGSTAATPVKVELLRYTGGNQTTLTAYTAAMITKFNDPNAPASSIQLATTLSGFSNNTTGSPRPASYRWRRTSFRPRPASTSSSRWAASRKSRCPRSHGSA